MEPEALSRHKSASQRFAQLVRLSAALTDADSADDVTHILLHTARRAAGGRGGMVALIEPDRTRLRFVATAPGHAFDPPVVPLSASAPATDATREGRPVYIADRNDMQRQYPHVLHVWDLVGTASAAILPLVVGGRVIGAMGFGFGESGPFDADERAYLNAIVGLVAQPLERTRVEARSRRHAELFHAAIQPAREGLAFALVDADLRIVVVNDGMAGLIGHQAEDLTGRLVIDAVPALAPFVVPRLRQVLDTGEAIIGPEAGGQVEAGAGANSSDPTRLITVDYTPVPGLAGGIAGVMIAVHDQAALRRTQAALAGTEAQLALAMDAARMGTWSRDFVAGTAVWDHNAEALYGVGHASDHTWEEFASRIHPDDLPIIIAGSNRARETLEPLESEYRVIGPDGEERWLLSRGQAVADETGEPTRMRGVVLDVTERHRAASEHERLAAELAHARRLESLGRLAGGVAHDFNNLLTIVNGTAQLVLRSMHPKQPFRAEIETILAAGRRGAVLTTQLLGLGRRDTPESRLQPDPLIRGLAELLARVLGERFVLQLELGAPDVTVGAGPAELEQVLVNLVLNAGDAMPDGGTVVVRTAAVAGGPVRISVIDSGTGMTEEVRQRAFEPFFTTKAPGQGTGLGLATVYGVVHAAGGDVEIRSAGAGGPGTEVAIVLPVLDVSHPIDEPHSVGDGDRGSEPGPSARTYTVLVAEDDPSIRELTRVVLSRAGFRVETAADAFQALSMVDHLGPDLDVVVSDIVMPGLSGPELADRLRLTRPGLPIVVMTGYSDRHTVVAAAGTEGVYRLDKPWAIEDLVAIVTSAATAADGSSRIAAS